MTNGCHKPFLALSVSPSAVFFPVVSTGGGGGGGDVRFMVEVKIKFCLYTARQLLQRSGLYSPRLKPSLQTPKPTNDSVRRTLSCGNGTNAVRLVLVLVSTFQFLCSHNVAKTDYFFLMFLSDGCDHLPLCLRLFQNISISHFHITLPK
ncbi:hypothetical protein BsWGS_14155 [Bradybaena similaris]